MSTVVDDLAAAAANSGPSADAAADRVAASIAAERGLTAAARQALEDYIAAHPDQTEALTVILNQFIAADAKVDSIEAAPTEPVPTPGEEIPPA